MGIRADVVERTENAFKAFEQGLTEAQRKALDVLIWHRASQQLRTGVHKALEGWNRQAEGHEYKRNYMGYNAAPMSEPKALGLWILNRESEKGVLYKVEK